MTMSNRPPNNDEKEAKDSIYGTTTTFLAMKLNTFIAMRA